MDHDRPTAAPSAEKDDQDNNQQQARTMEVFGDAQAGGIALFVLLLQVISYALTDKCTC
jgi:hypothetical protein